MLATGFGISILENDLGIPQGVTFPTPTRQRGAIRIGTACSERQVDPPVIREIRVQGDIQQASLPRGQYRRQTGHGLRIEFAVADQAQTPSALSDQR